MPVLHICKIISKIVALSSEHRFICHMLIIFSFITCSTFHRLMISNDSLVTIYLWQYMGQEAFPGASDGKESACNEGDLGSIPGLGRSPGKGHGYPLQYSCLENPHGQRSWLGYSPWGLKESDTAA